MFSGKYYRNQQLFKSAPKNRILHFLYFLTGVAALFLWFNSRSDITVRDQNQDPNMTDKKIVA
jgi:hypothetical protein